MKRLSVKEKNERDIKIIKLLVQLIFILLFFLAATYLVTVLFNNSNWGQVEIVARKIGVWYFPIMGMLYIVLINEYFNKEEETE